MDKIFPAMTMRVGGPCCYVAACLVALSLIVSIQCFSPSPPLLLSMFSSQHNANKEETTNCRRQFLLCTSFVGLLLQSSSCPSLAAPPIAIIAEELGYFPVTNRNGETVYVPKRVQRTSSDQAIELAKHLHRSGIVMYGAFWCPHCARQKELFGKEAWSYIDYIECAPNGYNANPNLCNNLQGFPTWCSVGKKTEIISGEVPLSVLAKASKFVPFFDEELEENVPPLIGSVCKQ